MTPRLTDKAGICSYLGGISPATYDAWSARGIVPGPVRGTNRYDIRAHDAALDRVSGINIAEQSSLSPLDQWERNHAA